MTTLDLTRSWNDDAPERGELVQLAAWIGAQPEPWRSAMLASIARWVYSDRSSGQVAVDDFGELSAEYARFVNDPPLMLDSNPVWRTVADTIARKLVPELPPGTLDLTQWWTYDPPSEAELVQFQAALDGLPAPLRESYLASIRKWSASGRQPGSGAVIVDASGRLAPEEAEYAGDAGTQDDDDTRAAVTTPAPTPQAGEAGSHPDSTLSVPDDGPGLGLWAGVGAVFAALAWGGYAVLKRRRAA